MEPQPRRKMEEFTFFMHGSATQTGKKVSLQTKVLHKGLFRIRKHYLALASSGVRRGYWRMQGMAIGAGTRMRSMEVTWPHKVSLGSRCNLEEGVCFNFAGGYSSGLGIQLGDGCFIGRGCEFNISARITLGESCLVGSGTRFIDHNHGMELGPPMKEQPEVQADIEVGPDVWIGANCVILRGVTLGEGAVVGAGSVVTKPVPAFSVVAGVPARLIRSRTPQEYRDWREMARSLHLAGS